EAAEHVAGGQDIDEDILTGERVAHQLDLAGGNDVQPHRRVAGEEDRLTGLVADLAEALVDALDLGGREAFKKRQLADDLQPQVEAAHVRLDALRLDRGPSAL